MTKIPLGTGVGDQDLCAWQPVRGVAWVQTRNPNHARRMAKRSDGRLVAYGVAGGFLKTFEFRRSLPWAVRLMKRYTAGEVTANEALGHAIWPERKLRAAASQSASAIASAIVWTFMGSHHSASCGAR